MQTNNRSTNHVLIALLFMFISLIMLTPKVEASDDKFVVGMEAGYPPFNWTQQNDNNGAVKIQGGNEYANGYDVMIAKRVAEGLGKELVIYKTAWDGLAPALTSGKVDAIIAGMSPTEERKKTIDFTNDYYHSNLVLVVAKDGKYANAKSLKDFEGAKVTAQLNTFHYSVIDQIEGVSKQTAMDDFSAMRVALQSGKIDAYVSEKPEGITAQKVNPNFKMIDFKDGQGFKTNRDDTSVSIGVKKGSQDIAKINDILAGINQTERDNFMDIAISEQPDSQSNENWIVKIVKENWQMFLKGAGVTLLISLVGTIVGTLIGLGIGLFRTIPTPKNMVNKVLFKLLNTLFSIYIEIFRGTPMIVQAMVIYYGSSQAFGIDMNPLAAALFIVSINTGAYMTEIVRGGIFSVDKGQFEAASAIGMTHGQTMVNVVIPQVFRNILPAMGNEFVINIKDTSVLNVIAVTELFFQAKTVAGSNFRFFDTFFVVCVIYFVMTFTVTRILRFVEKRMDGTGEYAPYANQMQTATLERKDDK